MRLRVPLVVLSLVVPFLGACSSGSSGGGGGGDGEAALAALGFTPNDVADMADLTMIGGLSALMDDAIVPTLRGDPCPGVTEGADGNANGHPDSLLIEFACTTSEGTSIVGEISLNEYGDPAEFVQGAFSCSELVAEAGTPEWGMQGSYSLDLQEAGGLPFTLTGSIDFAEFTSLGQLVIELHTSAVLYPLDGENTVDVSTNVCCTLPTDDSSDFPVGFVETFVFDGEPPAVLSLECQLLANGTVAFDAFGGKDLIASGLINPAAPDGEEVTFD